MSKCRECSKELTGDEIALHKRMLSREETSFRCLSCQAKFFGCDEALLLKKTEQFKKNGCLLFAVEQE